jgi:nitroimidazol reductase NimA-like FMN-containing flavoprotein (pyridoxamine 5'-phosphate oxidase superfamily)
MSTRKQATKQPPPAESTGPAPVASRPRFPKEYGVPSHSKGLLPWSHVTERLTKADHYWICTVNADNRPHATPVDGVWLNDCLYFGGSPESRWRRNLTANGAMSVHLENAMDVVMLEGHARVESVDRARAQQLAEVSNKKYGYGMPATEYEKNGVLTFRPRLAFAWTNIGKDSTRYEFGRDG